MHLLQIFAAGFASVFLLGFQSRNVNSGNYGWAAATSFLVCLAQSSLWHRIAAPEATTLDALTYGLSAAFGITAAMAVHRQLVARKP
jgi:hypothetical protein